MLLAAIGAVSTGGIAGCSGESSGGESTPAGEPGDSATETGTDAGDLQSTGSDGTAPTGPLSGLWRSTDGDPGNTSANTEMTGPTTTPFTRQRLRIGTVIESQPVIEQGVLYATTNETVYALSPTGERSWTYEVDSDSRKPIDNGLAVRDGTVYVPTADSLIALSDGHRQWSRDWTESSPASLITTDSAVYASTGRGIRSYTLDGEKRWEKSGRYPLGRPSVDGSRVYQDAGGNAPLFARDTNDGSMVWRRDDVLSRVPVAADGTVYTFLTDDSERTLLALDGADGSVRWERSVPIFAQPTVANDTVYLAAGGWAQALDATDGSLVWDRQYETVQSVSIQSKVYADSDSLYALGDNAVIALDRESGSKRWSISLPDTNLAYDLKGISLAGGRLYVAEDSLYEIS